MMTYPQSVARPVIFRARRDTIGLVAAATMSTFALAHAVQSHRIAMHQDEPHQVWTGGWTGGLAGVAPGAPSDASEPLTSASLVVPEEELALPQAPVRALVKLRGCGGDACTSRATVRTTAVPVPPRKVAMEKPAAGPLAALTSPAAHHEKRTLISRLNPLDHIPYASTIKRPFAIASDTVSGWFKR